MQTANQVFEEVWEDLFKMLTDADYRERRLKERDEEQRRKEEESACFFGP